MIPINNIIYPFIITLVAGLSTILGSLIIFFNIKHSKINKFITICLSFTISIMIGISITDLIPNSFNILNNYYNLFNILIIFIISFLIAFIIIKQLNILINKKLTNSSLYRLGILNMLVLIIHNLPEGIATFMSSYYDINLGIKLSIAIMLHNIPEGIGISVPIYYSSNNKLKAIKATIYSAVAEPIGALLSFLLFKNYINNIFISIILIIVGCIMITLSIEQILPKTKKYKENNSMILGLVIGTIVVIINVLMQ